MGKTKGSSGMVIRAVVTAVIFYAVLAILMGPVSAGIFMVALCVHEAGHIWAMKHCGIGLSSLNFIPLVGALAKPDRDFRSRTEEAFVAVMGPAWGFGSALVAYGLYLIFGLPELALVAKWAAILNAFNMIPVSPLDGGRVVKSLISSVSVRAGLIMLSLGPWIALAVTFYTGIWLLGLIAWFAYMEYKQQLTQVCLLNESRQVLEELQKELPDDLDDVVECLNGGPEAGPKAVDLFFERVHDGRFHRFPLLAEAVLEEQASRTPILGRHLQVTPEAYLYNPSRFFGYLKLAVNGALKPVMTKRQLLLHSAAYLLLGAALVGIWMLGDAGSAGLTFLDLMDM